MPSFPLVLAILTQYRYLNNTIWSSLPYLWLVSNSG